MNKPPRRTEKQFGVQMFAEQCPYSYSSASENSECSFNPEPFRGLEHRRCHNLRNLGAGHTESCRGEPDFIPAAQSGGCRGLPLYQLFILSSNLSLRCRSVYLLNLPHKQLNDGLSSLGNLWSPSNSKLK